MVLSLEVGALRVPRLWAFYNSCIQSVFDLFISIRICVLSQLWSVSVVYRGRASKSWIQSESWTPSLSSSPSGISTLLLFVFQYFQYPVISSLLLFVFRYFQYFSFPSGISTLLLFVFQYFKYSGISSLLLFVFQYFQYPGISFSPSLSSSPSGISTLLLFSILSILVFYCFFLVLYCLFWYFTAFSGTLLLFVFQYF